MSHPNKHVDDLQTRLNQARLIQQRNNRNASSFSFPRFVASLRAALQGLKKQVKPDPKELVCEFADAIPGFNEMLKIMNIQKVSHLGSDLFEITLLDKTHQVVSIHGKVLLEDYEYIHCCSSNKSSGYFELHPDETYTAQLLKYNQQGAYFETLVDRDQGYNGFVVLPDSNRVVISKKVDGKFVRDKLQLDTLQPVLAKETTDQEEISGKDTDFANRYYRNCFGIPGKHILKVTEDDTTCALFAIDPKTKKQKRITERHQGVLDAQHSDGSCIYAFDAHEDNSMDVFVYDIQGRLLHKKHYSSESGSRALSAFNPLPCDFHVELDDSQTHKSSKYPKIMCDKKGKKVGGLEFTHISRSGLSTTQCIRVPHKKNRFQYGLYSMEKQYRIIPPIMLSEIQFQLGVAVLVSPDGVKVVLAKDVLECENKGIAYQ